MGPKPPNGVNKNTAHLVFGPKSSSPPRPHQILTSQRKRMESSSASSSSVSVSTASSQPSKRLLFDRRYGWVVDEWKDPTEEALAGGRGMFCILPLAKALMKMASQSINLAANSAVKAFERPDLLSPQLLQAGLTEQLHKIKSSLPKPEFNNFLLKGNLLSNAAICSPRTQVETSKS